MQRRATSKKRAAEAEKEVDMGDKEATPVELSLIHIQMCIRDRCYTGRRLIFEALEEHRGVCWIYSFASEKND